MKKNVFQIYRAKIYWIHLYSSTQFYTCLIRLSQDLSTCFYFPFTSPSSDPVSPIFLTIDSVSSTYSSCELTVTCTTEDSNIHSTIKCDHKTCHPEKENSSVVTKSGASLDMYLLNSSVICNHSNQVSWSDDVRVIKHYCLHCTGKLKQWINI